MALHSIHSSLGLTLKLTPKPYHHHQIKHYQFTVKSQLDPPTPGPTEPEAQSQAQSKPKKLGFGSSSSPSTSSSPPPPAKESSERKQRRSKRQRASIIRRTPVEKPAFSAAAASVEEEEKARERGRNESAFLLAWLGLGSIILVQGIALAASGFLPEEWDKFFVKYLYPSFTPTVVLFIAGTVGYGVTKYLQNEKLKDQK